MTSGRSWDNSRAKRPSNSIGTLSTRSGISPTRPHHGYAGDGTCFSIATRRSVALFATLNKIPSRKVNRRKSGRLSLRLYNALARYIIRTTTFSGASPRLAAGHRPAFVVSRHNGVTARIRAMHHGVSPSTANGERCSPAKPCAIVKRCITGVSSPPAHVRYRSGITTFSGAFSPFSHAFGGSPTGIAPRSPFRVTTVQRRGSVRRIRKT
jgi:hypothetical protein